MVYIFSGFGIFTFLFNFTCECYWLIFSKVCFLPLLTVWKVIFLHFKLEIASAIQVWSEGKLHNSSRSAMKGNEDKKICTLLISDIPTSIAVEVLLFYFEYLWVWTRSTVMAPLSLGHVWLSGPVRADSLFSGIFLSFRLNTCMKKHNW